ncbi:MAG: hypothetical protein IKT22_04285 [Prevotella sp.]|nr:hypothetical protein [Prevotella sp.]MBR6494465.1 hypothetical protein [Prevotella sp.]
MKKEYLIPMIKTMHMAEPLMVDVSNSEIDNEEFELGAKDMDVDDDFSPVFTNKSVWDD